MSATIQDKPAVTHEDIAMLAFRIWQDEGCQHGRDREYWLQAEQLLAISNQADVRKNNTPVKRKGSPGRAENASA